MAESVINNHNIPIIEHPLVISSDIIVNGYIRCWTWGKVCFISLTNISFNNTIVNRILVSGVPKPVGQVGGGTPKGANTTESEKIKNNTCFIGKGQSDIVFNIESNNTIRHWMEMMYITE